MPSPAALPRVLDTDLIAAWGLSRQHVRTELGRGRWRSLGRGLVLTRPEAPTRSDWLVAALLGAGPGAALSGVDAATAYGLPVPTRILDTWPGLVICRAGNNRVVGPVRIRPSLRPVTTRRVPLPGDVPVRTVRAVSPARAVADAALVIDGLAPVQALVTAAVQRRLCTADALSVELASGPQNGSWELRRAVEDVHAGAMSVAEAETAGLLRQVGLPPFELNVPIVDDTGRTVAVADVLWRTLRAVLEVDSRTHHFAEPEWRRTMQRHNRLTRLGFAVTHWSPVELRGAPDDAGREIAAWLRARAVEVGMPWESLFAPAVASDRRRMRVPAA